MKIANILEMANRSAEQSEIWDLERTSGRCMGTFELIVFKVILGSLGAFVSKWHVTRKWLTLQSEMDWSFRLAECTSRTYMRYIWPCSFQGHFGVIQCICHKLVTKEHLWIIYKCSTYALLLSSRAPIGPFGHDVLWYIFFFCFPTTLLPSCEQFRDIMAQNFTQHVTCTYM